MRVFFVSLLQRLVFASLLGLAATASAQAKPDPNGPPDQFVLAAASKPSTCSTRWRSEMATPPGSTEVVNDHILPYVDFQKTTRLAAGRYWRQANQQQRTDLAEAFRGTLVRTYSGALTRVTPSTTVRMLPFRGDPKADDVVVRTLITQSNGQPTGVDYRLEKTPEGWKIYDLNVEGIWLIQNYRNQFAQQINQNGIDGLIQALNQRNQ